MKSMIRVASGIAVVFALLAFATSTIATAQGPTGTATPNATTAPAATTTPAPGGATTPAPGAACTNVGTFVSDVTVPDNSVVAPGQSFTKTWRIRNRGTCTWDGGYTLGFVSGQAMTTQASVPVPATAPGATADVSIPMTAPTTTGKVQGFWQLRSPNGVRFGPSVWVLINVGSGPAQAPALVPSGTNLDDPARARSFGSAIQSIPAGSAQWYEFAYDNADNALPRPTVTVVLLNGVTNGLTFEVYSPETLVGNWFDNKPVGRGTTEILTNCKEGDVNVGACTTNNLSWNGGFGLSGTYFVRVINDTGAAVAPQLIISGPGLSQCRGGNQASTPVTNPNGPFAQIRCAPTP